MIDQPRQEEILGLCQELVRLPSYSGHETAVAEAVAVFMRRHGFDEVWTDSLGNVVGGVRGSRAGKTVLLDGHLDTVPAKLDDWTKDPFGGVREGGRIYGRGASDMKGAVAAMLSAVAYFAEDTKRDFAGAAFVSCVVHEECFEGIASREVSKRVKPDFVVIGECSELDLKRGQRGRAEIVVETFGRPAHSANPQAGINAVYRMARLIERIRALPAPTHPVLGQGILELTDIKSSPYPGASVVPEYCRATYDRRLLVGETPASVLAPIEELIARLQAEDSTFKARASFARGEERCYTGAAIAAERFFPGWLFGDDDEWVSIALAGLRHAGLEPRLRQYSFCTNGSHYAGEAGIPTVGFGPSRENLAHTIDEFIEEAQLIAAARGYQGILWSALGGLSETR
jgi:putative selenium metabolism hydrolase